MNSWTIYYRFHPPRRISQHNNWLIHKIYFSYILCINFNQFNLSMQLIKTGFKIKFQTGDILVWWSIQWTFFHTWSLCRCNHSRHSCFKASCQEYKFVFPGSTSRPWWMLGLSDASGMYDNTGTMWIVYVLFVYRMKIFFLPWIWPTFNQIFLMIYLSIWLRKYIMMTGAAWIETRFGKNWTCPLF